jgi:DNA-binding response OmpR family regulator
MRISTSPLSALLLCDSSAARSTTRVLESYGFKVSTPATACEARAICRHTRFDLALYDEDSSEALELAANEPQSSARVVIMLAKPDAVRRVALRRFHFVVQKPFTRDLLAKTVRATFGVIARERRSSYRHQVSLAASDCRLTNIGEDKHLNRVTIVNISRTGMCIDAGETLPQEAGVEVSFTTQGAEGALQLKGVVVWSHASRAGIQLSKLDSEMQHKFEAWLRAILPAIDNFLPAASTFTGTRPASQQHIPLPGTALSLCSA